MYQVSYSQEFQSTRELLQEMPAKHLIETSSFGIWIPHHHILYHVVIGQRVSLLDEIREIAQGAELHHEMYVRCRLFFVYQPNNVWMV